MKLIYKIGLGILVLIMLFLVIKGATANTITYNQFNNSLASEEILFTSNGSQTRYLSMYQNVSVTGASIYFKYKKYDSWCRDVNVIIGTTAEGAVFTGLGEYKNYSSITIPVANISYIQNTSTPVNNKVDIPFIINTSTACIIQYSRLNVTTSGEISPTVTVLTPATDGYNSTPIMIQYNASDMYNLLDTCELNWNNTIPRRNTAPTNNQVNYFNWTDSEAGHEFNITCNNSEGLSGTSSSINITVDNTVPLACDIEIGDTDFTTQDNLEFAINATDVTQLYQAILETNETGVWTNYTAAEHSSPIAFTQDGSNQNVSLSWNSTSVCGYPFIVKFACYDTSMNQNQSREITIYPIPVINSSDSSTFNITNWTCEGYDRMILTTQSTAGFDGLFTFTAAKNSTAGAYCNYNVTNADMIKTTNLTLMPNSAVMCEINVTDTKLTEGQVITISGYPGTKSEKPSNLPNAVAAGVVGIIVLAYTITKIKKSTGW